MGDDLVEESEGDMWERRGLGSRLDLTCRGTHVFDGSGRGMVCLWDCEIIIEQS